MKRERVKCQYINQKIDDDNELDTVSKKTLKNYNKTIIELMEHGIRDYSTMISNTSSIPKRKFIEYIKMMYEEYELFDTIEEYKKYIRLDDYGHCLLIFKDTNDIREKEITNLLKDCFKETISVIIFSDKDKEYYKTICDSKDSFELDRLIEIYNAKCEEKDYFKYLKEKYKRNNLTCDITSEQFDSILNKFKKESSYTGIELMDYIYDYSIKNRKKDNKKCISLDSLIYEEKEKKPKVDIEKMVGLRNVKKQINDIRNYLEFRKKSNLNLDDLSLNLFLIGPSGTGKTTVAKMLGSIFYEFGLLESEESILITASRLTGEHVGETKNVTTEILRKAKGKLLIIDEAYNLYSKNYKNKQNPYNDEAIEILLDYLNDPKNIVIFCGYKKEMHDLYKANPGIESRIYKEIEFEDYTTKELMEILKNDLESQGLTIKNDITMELEEYIEECRKKENFGNARFIKNKLAQDLIINHSNRKLKKENYMIEKEDLPKIIREKGVGLV